MGRRLRMAAGPYHLGKKVRIVIDLVRHFAPDIE
jgi:hypothetical protein